MFKALLMINRPVLLSFAILVAGCATPPPLGPVNVSPYTPPADGPTAVIRIAMKEAYINIEGSEGSCGAFRRVERLAQPGDIRVPAGRAIWMGNAYGPESRRGACQIAYAFEPKAGSVYSVESSLQDYEGSGRLYRRCTALVEEILPSGRFAEVPTFRRSHFFKVDECNGRQAGAR